MIDAFQAATSKDDVLDSDLEDLVSCLDDEDANQLDLKELKEKKENEIPRKSSCIRARCPRQKQTCQERQGQRERGWQRQRAQQCQRQGGGKGQRHQKNVAKRLAKDRPHLQKSHHLSQQQLSPPATGQDASNEYSPGFSEGVPYEAQEIFADIAPEDPEAPTGLPASSPNAASALAEASLPPAEENRHVAEQDAEPATEPPSTVGEQEAPGEPASSSGANPPLQDVGSDAVAPPSSKQVPHTKGVPRPKIYFTPVEVLSAMLPPGCKIVPNHNEHRLSTTWMGATDGVPIDLKGKFFQESFVNKEWTTALSEIHHRLLEKLSCVSEKLPLAGRQPQKPGEVPQDVINNLKPFIKKLPEKRSYYAKNAKSTWRKKAAVSSHVLALMLLEL